MKKLYRLIPYGFYILAGVNFIQCFCNIGNSFETSVNGTLDLIVGLLLELHSKIDDYGHFTLHTNEHLAEMLKVFLGASEEESKDDVKEEK